MYVSVDERLILGQRGRSAFVGYHHSNFMPPEWDRFPVTDGRVVPTKEELSKAFGEQRQDGEHRSALNDNVK